ncbi:hypothetical protein KSP40_PGU010439 [Platanthera guangdongensis]|uniref:Uncharacterized protein n=1 Tax=Platanthera guangdongensis TaxID=2320717 RepID=A0ABR2LNT1_9ASPA
MAAAFLCIHIDFTNAGSSSRTHNLEITIQLLGEDPYKLLEEEPVHLYIIILDGIGLHLRVVMLVVTHVGCPYNEQWRSREDDQTTNKRWPKSRPMARRSADGKPSRRGPTSDGAG